MRLVLASKSPARRSTLISAGIDPIVLVSDVDEDAVLANLPFGRAFSGGKTTPAMEVTALAQAKCDAVTNMIIQGSPELDQVLPKNEELFVIGCDSMLELEAKMLGKPHSPAVAVQRIRDMRGKIATLWTGHAAALVSTDSTNSQSDTSATKEVGLDAPTNGDATTRKPTRRLLAQTCADAATRVHFGSMSDEEIDAYVATGEPLHVAGSFTIDALGGPFIEGVEGDHHSVVGISLPLVRKMAQDLGVFWPDLWRPQLKAKQEAR